jgi:hypothetical protein
MLRKNKYWEEEMIQIRSARSSIEAEMIKSILVNGDIYCELWDEHAGSMFPTATFEKGIRVMVRNKDSEKAKNLIEHFERK